MSKPQTTLAVVNNNGSLKFDSLANHRSVSSSHSIDSNSYFKLGATNDIKLETYLGNLSVIADVGTITIDSNADLANAIIIQATNSNGGILQTAGIGGINLLTSNGDIDILSQGANINIGVSPIGTPASQQTQNLNLECFNNFNVNSGDMYFVSSDVISFVSNTGDIQFGTSSNGVPIIKFENGNLLVNQNTSPLDYQLDVALTHPSSSKDGYNGIMVNSKLSNVAAEIVLQTSNTLGDGTQCILSMGSFGLDNNKAFFQKYLAFQTGNVVIRLDGPAYNPNSIDTGFGHDFLYSDIDKQLYWPSVDRMETILALGSLTTSSSDTSNLSVLGTYTGNTSRVYLLQIDSLGTPNTFKWSNNGGVSFQGIYIPILDTITPISLDSNISVLFTATTGFYYNQQFTFQTKITAIVDNPSSIPGPDTIYTIQPFYSYIETTTPSDIVIRTNSSEKMRITGDGAIGVQKKIPTACLDLNSNYNKVIMANQTITGYQINPSIAYLEYGGYMLVWNSQDMSSPLPTNFDIIGQRYLSDSSRYGANFKINNISSLNQSFPSVAGNKTQISNHYIVSWSNNNTLSGNYNIYCQIFHNNNPIRTYDIPLDTPGPNINQLYSRAASLYNGNYIVVWTECNITNNIYSIYGVIISDNATIITSKFLINTPPPSPLSRNYPYVAGLPNDDNYYPNGFVVGYMTAIDATSDPRYTVAIRIFNYDASVSSAEIPITASGSTAYSSISDGLLSVCEINKHNIGVGNVNGGFILAFYRSYQADTTLYDVGDYVSGNISGATASITSTDPSNRIITLQNVSNRFLVSEEITIISSIPNVGNIVEKIAAINFLTTSTANITLDIGSKSVDAYRYNSNVASTTDAIWSTQVNTSPLYNDLDRFNNSNSASEIYTYKRPLAAVSVDNEGTALITWSNGSIPSVYYQLIDVESGSYISTETRLTSQYDGLKQRDQVVTHLQSIQGNDYGFVISWDNQSLDLSDTGIYQQLIGYNHSLLKLEDGNSNFVFNHQNQLGIGITHPSSTLHIKTPLTSSYGDPVNTASITVQNTSQHVITKMPLQSINFTDGSNNILNKIESINSLRYDDLYPQPKNLIGFYKFDQSEGTQAIDYSSSSTYLSTSNVPVYINTNGILNNFDIENCWQPGVINNSLLYNGINNYVFVEKSALNGLNTVLEALPHSLSMSVWVNVPSIIVPGATYDIVSNGGNMSLAGTYLLSLNDLNSNGNIVATSNIIVNGSSVVNIQGNTVLNDSQWHHIVETIDLSSISNCYVKLYIDGVLENSIVQTGNITAQLHSTYNTYFGSRDGSSNSFFRGYMDELRFYNSIITANEVAQLYNYGNPNVPAKSSMILCPNNNNNTNNNNNNTTLISTPNQAILIDDNGRLNNLSSRPLPYTIISGEVVASSSNVSISGVGTNFLSELTVGDIIILGTNVNNYKEFSIITIVDNTNATLDRIGYTGVEPTMSYQSVLRRPNIYAFFDNSDSIRGHIDNYGNMIIGASKPSTMLEISGTSDNTNNIPEITITNTSQENTQYSRKTAINFKGYDTTNILNPPLNLGCIDVSHDGVGSNADNKGIMKFSVNSGQALNTLMSLTSNGNIGIGSGDTGLNAPLTLIHANTVDSSIECSLLLESNSNASITGASSVFDEKSNIYFGGNHSITENHVSIKTRVLAAISGSNDYTSKVLNGRLDFATNSDNFSTTNGIESRMSITHTGNVGVNILQPANIFHVAPELRLVNQINTILSVAGGGFIVNLSNNIFSPPMTTEQKLMFAGGTVVIENSTLSIAKIVNVSGVGQITVDKNLTAYVGNIIHIHYPGLNVSASSGFIGANTSTPGSVLSVNGSMSLPITNVSANYSLTLMNYTTIANCSSTNITITLPVNSSSLNGRIYVIKKYGSNTCYINPNGANVDNVGGTYTISNTFVHIQSDGSNWWIIANN